MKIKNKPRSAGILIENKQIALIERQRGGDIFYVFPGGSVDPGESPEQAVVREIREELGLETNVIRRIAESTYANRPHYYYLLERCGGVFGTGQGKELKRGPDSERGSVRPLWVPLEDLDKLTIYPAQMVAHLQQAIQNGWPDEPIWFTETAEGQ